MGTQARSFWACCIGDVSTDSPSLSLLDLLDLFLGSARHKAVLRCHPCCGIAKSPPHTAWGPWGGPGGGQVEATLPADVCRAFLVLLDPSAACCRHGAPARQRETPGASFSFSSRAAGRIGPLRAGESLTSRKNPSCSCQAFVLIRVWDPHRWLS